MMHKFPSYMASSKDIFKIFDLFCRSVDLSLHEEDIGL